MTVLHDMKEPHGVLLALLAVWQDEVRLVRLMSYTMVAMALLVLVLLQYLKAAYGRYTSTAWGFMVNGRLAWLLQELPAFLLAAYYLLYSGGRLLAAPPNTALLSLFLIHYIQRTFIFTYLIRGGKPTPVLVFLFAAVFCTYNGYLQGCNLAHLAQYPDHYCSSPRFIIGVAMFLSGMAINIHSDHVLRTLRRPGETGYKIPRGGLFELVSGANFFGEIVEWCGFAVAAWSLPTLAFAVFTAANIGPRALSHHQWYLDKFGSDYPRGRKALIPWIL